MKVGIDLDGTVYRCPNVFRSMIITFLACGHQVIATTGHSREQWNTKDRKRFERLGIPWDRIDASLLSAEPAGLSGPRAKAWKADHCDIVFDDHADKIQPYTKTPIFRPPVR